MRQRKHSFYNSEAWFEPALAEKTEETQVRPADEPALSSAKRVEMLGISSDPKHHHELIQNEEMPADQNRGLWSILY